MWNIKKAFLKMINGLIYMQFYFTLFINLYTKVVDFWKEMNTFIPKGRIKLIKSDSKYFVVTKQSNFK